MTPKDREELLEALGKYAAGFEPGSPKNHKIIITCETVSDDVKNQLIVFEEAAHDGVELTMKQKLITTEVIPAIEKAMYEMGGAYVASEINEKPKPKQ